MNLKLYYLAMLTEDKKHLKLFSQNILINRDLPKWKESQSQKLSDTKLSFAYNDVRISGSISNIQLENYIEIPRQIKSNKKTKFSKVLNIFKRFNKSSKIIIDINEFFYQIKLVSKDSKTKYINRIDGYLEAINQASKLGQIALVEKLTKLMSINKYESILYATGKYYAESEDQVVEFANKTRRGLQLDYIKNYIRPIPNSVISKLDEMNKLEVFDNYVILYYDPKNESSAKTEKEKEEEVARKKDPILFGVISGSNKLYYVTDWIDKYCDLTLDQFVETLKINKYKLKLPDEIDVSSQIN